MKRFEINKYESHGQAVYVPPEEMPESVTFDYFSPDAADRLPDTDSARVIAALDALGDAMITEVEGDTASGDAEFPPVYTYWGQFIDHDMTRNTDRNLVASGHSAAAMGTTPFDIRADDFTPIQPAKVRDELANMRTHSLDLDSVYGGGPQVDGELYCPGNDEFHCCAGRNGEFRIGRNVPSGGGFVVPPPDTNDTCRDLPRNDDGSGLAEIGDNRNDENLIVAQFHLAFLRFHNAALEQFGDFEKARAHTRLHYQWLVVNDFLRTIADADVLDAVIRRKHLCFDFDGSFMPVEFAAAAYRFGHTMVRASYDFNENFGRGGRSIVIGAIRLVVQIHRQHERCQVNSHSAEIPVCRATGLPTGLV